MGEAESPEPASPWANGSATVVSIPPCRRPAVRARGCWVYCDRQRPTLWPDHEHVDGVQVLVGFDQANCVGRWKRAGSRKVGEKLIKANQVWILPPRVRHEVEWRREADLIKLHLEPPWARECAGQDIKDISIESLDRYIRTAPIIGELCGLLRQQAQTRGPFNVPLISGLGAALAAQLMVSHFQDRRFRHPQRWVLPQSVLVNICAYIDAHLAEKLTLPTLAKVAGLSPSYFGQMFRAALGVSPMSYVVGQRVLRAREMLRRGQGTVAEVAYATGFSDQQQMNWHFRRLLHTPPSAYRPSRERR